MALNRSIRPAGPGRYLARAGFAFLVIVASAAHADPARDPTRMITELPLIGSTGGSPFYEACPTGQNLAGLEVRLGDDVDAVRPLCVIAYGPTDVGAPGADGTTVWNGGPGGELRAIVCPGEAPVVTGGFIRSAGRVEAVDFIRLFCGLASDQQGIAEVTVELDTATYLAGTLSETIGSERRSRCQSGQVAVGIRGRSGNWVDDLGLLCSAPRLQARASLPEDPNAIRPQGRVRPTDAPIVDRAALPICEAAAQARARNSPAAPGLARKCDEATAIRPVGRIIGGASGQPPLPICEAAAKARARNSPAAPGLEEQCLAIGGRVSTLPVDPATARASLDQLAAHGQDIAAQDAMIVQWRMRQPSAAFQRGFDIAVSASEGQTAWGPGKQAILDSLLPAEKEGFKNAISLVLDRNRHADFAAKGARVASLDRSVTPLRKREDDVRYWLGFDIASGLFGPERLGANGRTSEDPRSDAIRDGLSAAAQRGFRASAQLHLGRVY